MRILTTALRSVSDTGLMQLGLWYSPGRKRANRPSPSRPLDCSGPAAKPQSAAGSNGPVGSARMVQAQYSLPVRSICRSA